MPLSVSKSDFFQNVPNLGEPQNLNKKSFLTLDSTKYLEDLKKDGNLFKQFLDESQKFDFRYNVEFDSQYAYSYTGNVSGKVTNFPQGASPFDYVVDVFVFTDQTYFIESVPVGADWTFTTISGTNIGNKICHLVSIQNIVSVGGGGEVTNFGTVLSEDYVTQPTEGYRFPRSYNVDPNHSAFEQLRFRSFGYDVAATIVALVSMGEEEYATQYCLALIKTQQRLQPDDGGNPTNQINNGRLPFSSFLHNPQFLIDPYFRSGAEFWMIGAMFHFKIKFPVNPVSNIILGQGVTTLTSLYNEEYVVSIGLQNGCFRGGKGRYITSIDTENNQLVYLGFDPNYSVPWCANEHNVDAYFSIKSLNSISTFPLNAIKRTVGIGWISASIEKQETSNMLIEAVLANTVMNNYMSISPVAKSTTLDPIQSSVGGFSMLLSTTNTIYYVENGGTATSTGISTIKGDKISLEFNATDLKFRIYLNDALIFTSNIGAAAPMNIHFGSNTTNDYFHKITYESELLGSVPYNVNKPILHFDLIHSDLTQNIIPDIITGLETALKSPTQFYESTEKRGRRGISLDVFNGDTGLVRNAGISGWIGGGVSVARLNFGELHEFSYLVDNLSTGKIAGFGIGNSGESIGDVDFGWELNNGIAYPTETNFRKVFDGFNVIIGDKLSISIDTNNIITYYINGILKYTSLITPTFPLLIDCSIFQNTASLTKCMLDGTFVQWESGSSLVNCAKITESSVGLLDNCHALDNMTWYALARYDMGDIIEGDACVDYVLNGNNGSYSTLDTFYSAIGLKTYIPNNGCYTTPVSTALMWTEGFAGYIMALKAKGDDLSAKTNFKEIAKVSRIDGIPYVTRADSIYELQDWGCLIASAWTQIANKPNGWWGQNYSQILTGNGL